MKPATKSGQPIESGVVIPITFDLPPMMITNPEWTRKPTAGEVGRGYPVEALKANKSGAVKIMCTVATDGLLRGCTVIEEQPKGFGFGSAAILMSSLFVMKPELIDGVLVGGARVTIPINFKCDSGCSSLTAGGTLSVYRRLNWLAVPTPAQIIDA